MLTIQHTPQTLARMKNRTFKLRPRTPEFIAAFAAIKAQHPEKEFSYVGSTNTAHYFQEWGNPTPFLVPSIPAMTTPAGWAQELAAQDRAYHIDDDPGEIVNNHTGEPLFTPEECTQLRAMLETLTDEQREEIFAVFIAHAHAQA